MAETEFEMETWGLIDVYIFATGLPHAHMLIKVKDKPRSPAEVGKNCHDMEFQVNEMVQAELPVNDEPELCQAIIEAMVHGHRGALDRSCPRMKEVNSEI